MKKSLKAEMIVQLAELLELGLRAGRDWTQVFVWIQNHHPEKQMQDFCRGLLSEYKVQTSMDVFRSYELQSKDPLERIFFQMMRQGLRNATQLSDSLSAFIQTAKQVRKLRMQQKSLMFLPKFQALTAFAIVLIFVGILPVFSSQMFPSFLSIGRWDLFAFGFGGICLGFGFLWQMSIRPQRRLNELLSFQFFFLFMANFVRGGMDLPTAWVEALGGITLRSQLDILRPQPGLKVTSFKDFIESRIRCLPLHLSRNLVGLLWILPTGCGVSDFLQSCANRESERLIFEWEDEVRKLSVTSILPLSLLIFPSALFLLAGPQVLGAFSL